MLPLKMKLQTRRLRGTSSWMKQRESSQMGCWVRKALTEQFKSSWSSRKLNWKSSYGPKGRKMDTICLRIRTNRSLTYLLAFVNNQALIQSKPNIISSPWVQELTLTSWVSSQKTNVITEEMVPFRVTESSTTIYYYKEKRHWPKGNKMIIVPNNRSLSMTVTLQMPRNIIARWQTRR